MTIDDCRLLLTSTTRCVVVADDATGDFNDVTTTFTVPNRLFVRVIIAIGICLTCCIVDHCWY